MRVNRRTALLSFALVTALSLATLFGERVPVLYEVADFIEGLFTSPQVVGLAGPAELVRVTDGDTVVVNLDGREEKLRLIGIDTPEKYMSDKLRRDAEASPLSIEELRDLGEKASAYTASLVEDKPLYLEFDATERDRYGRVLAYVYTRDPFGEWQLRGERFSPVNLAIVQGGWAEPLTIPPNVRYADDYVAASREAKSANRGMWRALP